MSKSKFALPDGGANLFCGDLRQSVGASVGEDAGCGLIGCVGSVFVVDGGLDLVIWTCCFRLLGWGELTWV